jgi:hypothetical protein
MAITSVFLVIIKDFRGEYQGKLAEFENFSKISPPQTTSGADGEYAAPRAA